ncbi:hypothetical protein [Marinomonas ostreistagni]|uniref:Phosphoribulokinase/uridine kinase domain-containing protein n=1 Tax=Marinomonas ostreistagni TaxID=359209 RepID=A0ABS0Z6Q3_9GAMM|nr:hypothetical protein [Marinomonas ostreistagni]MBJ7549343.1 hypothetical protein [Marinomonas ostreistagni]
MTLDLFRILDQKTSYQDALAKVKKRLEGSSGRYIIGIAGLPGSGKSTLANYIEFKLNRAYPKQVVSVSMDGFHFSKAQLHSFPDSKAAFDRRGAPWTFDSERFHQHLNAFKSHSHQTLTWPSFDHTQGDPIEDSIIIPSETKLLIVEGLYILHAQHGFEQAQQYLDEKWYIDIPIDMAMTQLMERHQKVWGISSEEAKQRIAKNDALNAQIVEQTKSHADYFLSIM